MKNCVLVPLAAMFSITTCAATCTRKKTNVEEPAEAPPATASSLGSTASSVSEPEVKTHIDVCPAALSDTRAGGTEPHRYVTPTSAERSAMRDAITRLASAQQREQDVAAAARAAGFELAEVREIPGT